MRVLVTGAHGFIGKNLVTRLRERADVDVLKFVRDDGVEALTALVAKADAIVHLAGENRPSDVENFARVNTELTRTLCETIRATGRSIQLILASSTQAVCDNPYGQSKRAAELVVECYAAESGNPAVIYRLPGVFGKWCKPNYNSVVATFCYNIARDLPLQIKDAATTLQLVYIDDLVDEFLRALDNAKPSLAWGDVAPIYDITLGQLVEKITAFKNCRNDLFVEHVGAGITHALYSTYISYLPPERFVYDLPQYSDERGVFVEMLKTKDCGQFSFFSVSLGVTRGSHYHHSKTEKFLIVRGSVRMCFRHIVTGETFEVIVSGDKPQIVDTIPGWAHNITNIGDCEALVMLWANEVFDRQRPDCIPCKV